MTYAALGDVQNYLPPGYTIGLTTNTPSSDGVPGYGQVQAFLTRCSNEIDAAVASRGLSVPVTTPAWFLTELLQLNAEGAAALVLGQIFSLMQSQTPATVGSGSTALNAQLWTHYQKRLTEIRSGVGIPVGVNVAEADLAPRDYLTDTGAWGQADGTASAATGAPVSGNPAFTREMVY